jgi:hypothetical protein
MVLDRRLGRSTSIVKRAPTGINRWSSKREAEPPPVTPSSLDTPVTPTGHLEHRRLGSRSRGDFAEVRSAFKEVKKLTDGNSARRRVKQLERGEIDHVSPR